MFSTIIYRGEGSSFIAGFNTMSKEEQETYDQTALGKFVGKSMFAITGCLGLTMIAEITNNDWLIHVSFGLIFIIVVWMVIYVNTKNRFKKKG